MSAFSVHKLKQAQERLHRGDVVGAQALCAQVLERAPRNPDALCLLGCARLMSGQPREAIPFLQKALEAEPHDGMALEHLGLAHLLLGEFAEAEPVLRRAAALNGAPASVAMRLGIALLHQDKPAEALHELQRALAMDPQSADCHLNLGQAHAQAGDWAAARGHFETVLELDPGHVDALYNLGVLSLGREELGAAQQWFERALAGAPRHADALANLGIVLQRQSRLDAAAECFRRALALDPRLAPAGNNLARTLALQGRLVEAREQYRRTLELAPDLMEAREGYAAACVALGRLKEGIAALREIVRRDPGHAAAWSQLADALFQSGELDEARSSAERANTIDPDATGPYSALALVHIVRGETEQAIAVLEDGFRRTSGSGLLGMLAHQVRRACDWEKARSAWAELAPRLDHATELGSPFWLLSDATTPGQQLAYTRRWAKARFGAPAPRRSVSRAEADQASRRLRVGYLSSDFYDHATAYLLAGVLERHDRERVEIFAYSYGPDDAGRLRARVRQACEHFIDVAWDPHDAVVRRIEDDRLDVLVDLKGYTLGARTAILARRPCAIQVNWLGYPGTMGAEFIDYLIADEFIIPSGRESAYSERVVRLDPCWQCNDRGRPVVAALTRSDYGLPDDAFVFCCFNQTVKVTPAVFACWMRLLARAPASVLWLAEDNPLATRNLAEAAQAHGIARERVVFSPRLPYAQHLARYQVADLALDTFPYTSHSTASDALWLGCPLVALCGETFAARVSGSILTACGLPELITYSLAEYEALAGRIATDRDLASRTRSQLSSVKETAPLFDAARYARNLERIYRELVERAGG